MRGLHANAPESHSERKDGGKRVFNLRVQRWGKRPPAQTETILKVATRWRPTPTVPRKHTVPGSHCAFL